MKARGALDERGRRRAGAVLASRAMYPPRPRRGLAASGASLAAPATFAALALLAASASARACTLVPLSWPAAGQVLDEPRPTLRWDGEAGASHRVQIALVLPESRLLASHDVQVAGTRWTLPADLPAERAAVKVVVSRGCPSLQAQDLHARGPAFFIDLRTACSLPAGALRQDGTRVAWPAVPGAQAYQVRLFAPAGQAAQVEDTMVLVSQARVTEPVFTADRPAAGTVATVQPLCGGRPGGVASQVLR